ncbi:MAG TPA: FIST N-terminal domain-containing protein [Ktedonobacteraceae bacterium]|nr:FIST N-terminal domain-containing protein [Ktedonobacteraceae bacterium]
MKIEHIRWQNSRWEPTAPGKLHAAQLVLLFGCPSLLKEQALLQGIQRAYPSAHLIGCSTAGEISDTQVLDESLVVTAVQFEQTTLHGVRIKLKQGISDFHAGELLAKELDKKGLVHVLVFSRGVNVNGSDLVAGLTRHLPPQVTITGGLSGDGTRFQETIVVWEGRPETESIIVLGFYSKRLLVSYGSLGGWETFGPKRLITRSVGNVLYELDGKLALPMYKAYLGEHALGLPATGLLFPLSLLTPDSAEPVVRTILSVNEAQQSITFAGDVPEGMYARFMRSNFDRLVDGAVGAAMTSYEPIRSSPDLAVLISCVGRKLVLKQRIDEEVKGVRAVLGDRAVLTGFYSYGEISPFTPGAACKLHNQTMTITTFSER